MMRKFAIFTMGFLLAGATAVFGAPADEHSTGSKVKAKTKAALRDTDTTMGRVKELVPGQKVVIAIDNAPDKTFDLADKDLTVHLGKGLKVGDPVKVTEHEVAGKTKSVTIAKHAGGGAQHGDKTAPKS